MFTTYQYLPTLSVLLFYILAPPVLITLERDSLSSAIGGFYGESFPPRVGRRFPLDLCPFPFLCDPIGCTSIKCVPVILLGKHQGPFQSILLLLLLGDRMITLTNHPEGYGVWNSEKVGTFVLPLLPLNRTCRQDGFRGPRWAGGPFSLIRVNSTSDGQKFTRT